MGKKKNPVLEKKYHEGYRAGFKAGADYGRKTAIQFFAERLSNLQNTKGIGKSTFRKVVNAIGKQYFRG